jgi:hypothetical protein
MTNRPSKDWPPLDPSDEESQSLIQDLEKVPETWPEEAEDIPFTDPDSEEMNLQALKL